MQRIVLMPAVLLVLVAPARADIFSFGGNGTGWQLNTTNSGSDPGTISGNVYTPTDGTSFLQGNSAFYATPQPYAGGFSASFTYQATDLAAAFGPPFIGGNGVAFILQNDPRGALAVGGTGNGLAYGNGDAPGVGLTNTAGLELNIFAAQSNGDENFVTATSPNTVSTFPFNPAAPVVLNSGDPILVTLTYNAALGTVSEVLKDTITLDMHTAIYSGIHLSSVLGPSATALVGFSGSDGEATSLQTISNFSYIATVPEPSSLILCGLGTLGLLVALRRRQA